MTRCNLTTGKGNSSIGHARRKDVYLNFSDVRRETDQEESDHEQRSRDADVAAELDA